MEARMGEIDKDKRQIELLDYIEDAENGGPPVLEKTLSDEDLDSAGLVAIKAFVRSKASKNAERVRRAAERREKGENGPPRKQLNLQAPVEDDAREVLKQLNSALLDHSLTPDDIKDALGTDAMHWIRRAQAAEGKLEDMRLLMEKIEKEAAAVKEDLREARAEEAAALTAQALAENRIERIRDELEAAKDKIARLAGELERKRDFWHWLRPWPWHKRR
jgi:predicted  nucleic acid-binding Zn-ribbon protein